MGLNDDRVTRSKAALSHLEELWRHVIIICSEKDTEPAVFHNDWYAARSLLDRAIMQMDSDPDDDEGDVYFEADFDLEE